MTVAAALFLSGCGSCFEPFQKEAATIALETSFMVLGETSRREVHESLGQPRATSRYWGFDLFQRSRNAVSSLVMVGYDANDRVVRFESGSAYAGGEAGMCGPEEKQVLQAGVASAVIKPPFGTIDGVAAFDLARWQMEGSTRALYGRGLIPQAVAWNDAIDRDELRAHV